MEVIYFIVHMLLLVRYITWEKIIMARRSTLFVTS